MHLQVDLTAQVPSIEKMDASLGVLKACRYAQHYKTLNHWTAAELVMMKCLWSKALVAVN